MRTQSISFRVGKVLGEMLEKLRRAIQDHVFESGGDDPVVQCVFEVVRRPCGREIGDDVDVDLERLGPFPLFGQGATDTGNDKSAEFDAIG